MGRGRRLGGVQMKAVAMESMTKTSTTRAMVVALREEAATIQGMSEAGCMVAMRGADRGVHIEGIGILVLSSKVALEGAVVIMGLATVCLMCMSRVFQCITKW
jgi:hypothetical protein